MNKRQFLYLLTIGYFYPSQLFSNDTQDDTEHLQSLLNNKGSIILEPNKTYVVKAKPGNKSALYIRSNTTLDMAGSTILLNSNGSAASLITNRNNEANSNNIHIRNGILLGGGTNQPARFQKNIGITPTIYLRDIQNLSLQNLLLEDTYTYSMYIKGNQGNIQNVYINNAIGGGIHIDGDGWDINNVNIKNISNFDKINAQGNPFKVYLKNSTIGDIYCENFAFGIKFQGGCKNLVINSIVAKAGPLNEEYMLKVQGKKTTKTNHPNHNLQFNNIELYDGPLVGMYIYNSFDIVVNSYTGSNNGSKCALDSKTKSDILIIDSGNIRFKDLEVDKINKNALWLHRNTNNVYVESALLNSSSTDLDKYIKVLEGNLMINNREIKN